MPPKISAKKFVPPTEISPAIVINDHRRVMSAIRAATPIIKAMIVEPGSDANASLRAHAIAEMVKSSQSSAQRVMSVLMPDLAEKNWARSEAFAFCAGIISEEWMASQSLDKASSVIDDDLLMQIQHNVIGANDSALKWMDKVGEYPPIVNHHDAASRIRMSVMKAATPLAIEINRFAFWQSMEKRVPFIEKFVTDLTEHAAAHANKISDEFSITPEDRISLWQGDLNRTFSFAIEEYKRMESVAYSAIDAMGGDQKTVSEEKARWYRKAVSGELQLEILARVSSNFAILDGVANRICLSMQDPVIKASKQSDDNNLASQNGNGAPNA